MRKTVAILCVVVAIGLVYLASLSSCGNVDPADAPYTAEIYFNIGDETIDYSCFDDDTVEFPRCVSNADVNSALARDWRWVEAFVVDTGGRTGATALQDAAPLNNIEVRIMTWPVTGDRLWLVDDDRSAVPPLAQPYYTETDERGHIEIIWEWDNPQSCNVEESHFLMVSAGSVEARLQMDVSCGEAESADDDDSGDDDDSK